MKKWGYMILSLSLLATLNSAPIASAASVNGGGQVTGNGTVDETDIPDDVPNYSPDLDTDLYGEDGGSGTAAPQPSTGNTGNDSTTAPVDAGNAEDQQPTTPADGSTTDQPVSTQPSTTPVTPTVPVTGQEGSQGSEAVPATEEGVDPVLPILDKSGQTFTDGFYVDLYAALPNDGTVPTMDLELWNATTNKLISKFVASKNNYNPENSTYKVVFPTPKGYKLNDQFAIILKDKDPIVSSITFKVLEGEKSFKSYKIDGKSYLPVTALKTSYLSEKNTILSVQGSVNTPVTGGVNFDTSNAVFKVTDTSGVPLKNLVLTLTNDRSKQNSFTVKTNDKGIASVALTKLTQNFMVSAPNRFVTGDITSQHQLTLPIQSDTAEYRQPAYFPLTMESRDSGTTQAAQGTTSNALTVNISGKGVTDLSKSWMAFQLDLTSASGQTLPYDLTQDDNKVYGLADGTYKVSVTPNDYANVSLSSSSVTVQNGKATLSATITPKYSLLVDKDGQKYSFSVMNVNAVASKAYTGSGTQVFGVTPGESYMIQDNETNTIHSVIIEQGAFTTHVVLGAGVVAGGSASAASPHTGDTIVYWGILMGITGGTLAYLLLRRKPAKQGVNPKAE